VSPVNIADVMDELGTALEGIPDLRVFPYWAPRITPPTAIVGWPDPLSYDRTMARGMDSLTLPVFVLVGAVDARTSRDVLAAYLNGSGVDSIKTALDGGTYTACHTVTVRQATVETMTVAAVDYLGATFDVDITGSGT
jgi:hypothetical protein